MDTENTTIETPPEITPELVEGIIAGTIENTLPMEMQQDLRDYMTGEKKFDAPAGDTADADADAEAAAATAAAVPAAAAPATSDEDDAVAEIEARAAAELATAAEIRAANASFEEKNAAYEEIIKKPAPDDKYSDEYDQWSEARSEALRGQNALLAEQIRLDREHRISASERSSQEAADAVVSRHVDRLGAEYPAVKLPKPYSQAKADYNNWARTIVAANGSEAKFGTAEFDKALGEAFAKYKEGGEFATKPGVAPPAEFETFSVLRHAEILSKKAGISMKAALAAVAADSGTADKWLARPAAAAAVDPAEAAKATTAALDRRNAEPKIADVGGAASKKVSDTPVKGDKPSCYAYLNRMNAKMAKGETLAPDEQNMMENAREWASASD